jgi:hypothetical protein
MVVVLSPYTQKVLESAGPVSLPPEIQSRNTKMRRKRALVGRSQELVGWRTEDEEAASRRCAGGEDDQDETQCMASVCACGGSDGDYEGSVAATTKHGLPPHLIISG